MTVLGIGGVFFRAQDPEALTAWWVEHFGVGPGCSAPGADAGDEWTWGTLGGPVVFAPMPVDSGDIPAGREWRLNLRVSDLDGLLASLRGAGVDVETRPEWDDPSVGRFARLADPEGNGIELWEPPSP